MTGTTCGQSTISTRVITSNDILSLTFTGSRKKHIRVERSRFSRGMIQSQLGDALNKSSANSNAGSALRLYHILADKGLNFST